jgi:hypothetical protein
MNGIIILGLVLGVAAFVIQFIKEKSRGESSKKEEWLPYTKKIYLLTSAEHEFFNVLEQAMEGKYYIFPQLALDKLVLLSGKGSYRGGYRNKIDQKSVDFVLFNKQNVSPVLVIELDDFTHERPDRQIRDGFVDKVMNHCNIPILHTRSVQNIDELRDKIAEKIRLA